MIESELNRYIDDYSLNYIKTKNALEESPDVKLGMRLKWFLPTKLKDKDIYNFSLCDYIVKYILIIGSLVGLGVATAIWPAVIVLDILVLAVAGTCFKDFISGDWINFGINAREVNIEDCHKKFGGDLGFVLKDNGCFKYFKLNQKNQQLFLDYLENFNLMIKWNLKEKTVYYKLTTSQIYNGFSEDLKKTALSNFNYDVDNINIKKEVPLIKYPDKVEYYPEKAYSKLKYSNYRYKNSAQYNAQSAIETMNSNIKNINKLVLELLSPNNGESLYLPDSDMEHAILFASLIIANYGYNTDSKLSFKKLLDDCGSKLNYVSLFERGYALLWNYPALESKIERIVKNYKEITMAGHSYNKNFIYGLVVYVANYNHDGYSLDTNGIFNDILSLIDDLLWRAK